MTFRPNKSFVFFVTWLPAIAMLAGCATDPEHFQEMQCTDIRKHVTEAQDGFQNYKQGAFFTSTTGQREWTINPPFGDWESCKVMTNEAEKSNTVVCTISFPRGQFGQALQGYKLSTSTIRNCIVHGASRSSEDYGGEGDTRRTVFELDQASNELYAVTFVISLTLFPHSSGGGSESRLEMTAQKRLQTVR